MTGEGGKGRPTGVLGILAMVVVSIAILFGSIFAGLLYLFDSEIDRVVTRSFSPDRRRVIEIVHRDHGYGLGLTEIYAVVRMRRAKGWGLGRWNDVLSFDERGLKELVGRPTWSDDHHVALTFSDKSWISPERFRHMGVEIEIRREGRSAPASPPPP